MMKSIAIKKITLEGFKGYSERKEFIFSPEGENYILGHNGAGKTSVGDAIVWAIHGSDIFGNQKAPFLNKNGKHAFVEVIFQDETGAEHCISRECVLGNKNVQKNHIVLNGISIKEKDLGNYFSDKITFLSLYNPLYFLECLSDNEKKTFFDKLLFIKSTEIQNRLSPDIRQTISDAKINLDGDLMYKMKMLRDEIKELQQNITYTEGRIDQIGDPPPVPDIEDIKLQLDGISKQKVSIEVEQLTQILKEKKTELEEFQKELNKAYLEKGRIEGVLEQAKYTKDSLARQRERLRDDYKKANIRPDKACPSCGQNLPQEKIAQIENKVARDLAEIKKDGEGINQKLTAVNSEISAQEALLKEFPEKFTVLDKTATNLQSQINDIQSEIIKETSSQMLKYEQKKTDLDRALKIKEDREILSKSKQTVESYKRLMEIKNKTIKAIQEYNGRKVEVIEEKIRPYLENLSVTTHEIVKTTGEIKDGFKLLYNGKEFSILSYSERVKMALELGRLFRGIMSINIPIFIDNRESISELPSCTKAFNQIIEAYVVKQDLEIVCINNDNSPSGTKLYAA